MSNVRPTPGVYPSENNQSANTVSTGVAAAGYCGAAIKGPLGIQGPFSSDQDLVNTYGNPDPQYGYSLYQAIQRVRAGGTAWFNRVVTTAGLYAVMLYSNDGTNPEGLKAGAAQNTNNSYSFLATDLFAIFAIGPGTGYSNVSVTISNLNASTQVFVIKVFLSSNPTTPVETWTVSLNFQLDGFHNQMELETVINNASKYIRVLKNTAATAQMASVVNGTLAFTNGVDGNSVADSDIITGWQQYNNPTLYPLNLLVDGGYATTAVAQAMDLLARTRNDCMAFVSTPVNAQATGQLAQAYASGLSLSSFSAVFVNDQYYYDDYSSRWIYVPLSGEAAARCSYTDQVAFPWYPICGLNRGVLNNCGGLRYIYQSGDTDLMSTAPGVNYAIKDPQAGYVLWEQMTRSPVVSSLSYINVRRGLCVHEPTMTQALRVFIGELNNSNLWAQISQLGKKYFDQVQANNGVYNYRWICDSTNNNDTTIANGIINVYCYLEPQLGVRGINLVFTIFAPGGIATSVSSQVVSQ